MHICAIIFSRNLERRMSKRIKPINLTYFFYRHLRLVLSVIQIHFIFLRKKNGDDKQTNKQTICN